MKNSPLPAALIYCLLVAPLAAQEPNEKAARYLDPLLKRPGSGPLFERFVDAWLDTDTLENLEKYLIRQVEARDTTANRLLLAVYLSRQGDMVQALEQFRAALARDPGSADIWFQKAVVEARTLDFDNAVASLKKALETKPAAALSLQASQLLGRLLARSGKTDEALKVWQDLMAQRPDDDELREDVLELQIAEGLHAAAQATAEALVAGAKDPYKKVLRRLRLGDVHDRAGARDKALETYASCLEDSGADSWLEKEITAQIEKLFRREDDLAGLKTFYAKLLEKDGRRVALRRSQARLLMEMNESDAAIASGRELLKLAPGDRTVRDEFIALLSGAGKVPEAIEQLEALRKQTPADGELLLRLAALQNEAGKKPEAAASVQEFLKLSGDEAARLRASGFLERCGLFDEAVTVLKEGGEVPALQQALAGVLHKSGKKEEALAVWRKLAETDAAAALEVSRALSVHGETEAVWSLLKEHAVKGAENAAYLTALCLAAEQSGHAEEALPHARRLLALASLPADVDSALDIVLKLARKADRVEALLQEVQAGAAQPRDCALLAALREEARDSAGAEAALKQAEAASPELAASLLVKIYIQRGDFLNAAQATERLFQSPAGRKAHHAQSLTDLWLRAGNAENALKAVREWRRLAPGNAAPVLAEARLLTLSGQEKESLAVLRQAAGQFENNDEVRAELADTCRRTGRMPDALRIYSALYENAPDLAGKMRWMQQWAQTAEEAGRSRELVEQFEERRRTSRESIVPLLALAEIHRVAGNYDSRRKALMEAARLKPNDAELALEIARLETREDDSSAAIRTLRAALPHDQTGKVREELVLALLRSGERDEGLRLLSEGQEAALQDPAVVEGISETLAQRDSAATALAFLQPHLDRHPGDYRLQILAAAMEMAEQPDTASARLMGILSQRDELPPARLKGLAKPVRTGEDMTEFFRMLSRVLPPQASEFFILCAAADKARSRQQGGRTGSASVPQELPDNLEAARTIAAGLLLHGAMEQPEEKAAAILTAMERQGRPAAALVRRVGLSLITNPFGPEFVSRLAELTVEDPANDNLLALAAASQLFDWQSPGNAAIGEKVWKRFSADRPELALPGALPAVTAGQTPWEQEVLSKAETITVADPMLVMGALRAVGLNFGGAPRMDVTPEVRTRVFRLLQRWYGASEFRGATMEQVSTMIFLMLAGHYAEAQDAAGLAALLDGETSRSGNKPSQFIAMIRGSGQSGSVARALGFPPAGVPLGIPEIVTAVISEDLSVIGFNLAEKLGNEGIKQAAAATKHPVVKTLLLLQAGDEAGVGEVIDGLLAAPVPDGLSCVLAAAWAERQGDFPRAVELANKALFLPLSRDTRKALDAAFLSWAESDPASETVKTAAREAALRTRRDVLSSQDRAALASIMGALGMNSEAEKLTNQDAGNQAAFAGGSASPGRRTPPGRSASGRLLAAGKKDEALPLLAKELLAFARDGLKPDGWSTVQGFDEWLSGVKEHAMLDAVVKAASPAAEEQDAKKLAVWAAALDMTGNTGKAVEALRRALAAGSQDAGVRSRLMRRIVRRKDASWQREAAELLVKVPDDQLRPALALVAPIVAQGSAFGGFTGLGSLDGSYFDMALDFVIDGAEVTGELVNMLPPARLRDADWLDEALQGLGCQASLPGDWTAGALFTEGWETPSNPYGREPVESEDAETVSRRKNATEMQQRRAALYDRLVAKLITVPGSACRGWMALRLRTFRAGGQPLPESLLQQATACILLDLQDHAARDGKAGDGVWHEVFKLMLPDAFMLGRLDEVETTLLPGLRKVSRGVTLDHLEQMWTLYRCPAEEFNARAKEIAAKPRGIGWQKVLEAATFRKGGPEIADDLMTRLVVELKGGSTELGEALTAAALLVEKNRGAAGLEAWLRKSWQDTGGSAQERTRVLAVLDAEGSAGSRGRRQPPPLVMAELQAALWSEPALLFPALRVWDEEFMACVPAEVRGKIWERFRDRCRPALVSLGKLIEGADTDAILKFLKQSPFLGAAATFRSYGGEEGIYDQMVDVLLTAPPQVQMQLGFSGSAETMSFGESLLTAAISEDRETVIPNTMARWREAVIALPPAQQEDVVTLLQTWIANSGESGLSKEGAAFANWIENYGEEEEDGADEVISAFFDPKNVRQLRAGGSWTMGSAVEDLLEKIIEANSPRLWEVVITLRDHPALQSTSAGEHLLAEGLGRLTTGQFTAAQQRLLPAGIIIHAAAAPGSRPMPVTDALLSMLDSAGREMMIRGQRDPGARARRFVEIFARIVREGEAPLLLPVLAGALSGVEEKDCDTVLTWAEGPGSALERQDIVQEIAAAARFMKDARAAAREEGPRRYTGAAEEAGLSPDQQHYLAVLQDGSLLPQARLMVAAFLARTNTWNVGEPLVREAVTLLEQTAQARNGAVQAWQETAVLELLTVRGPQVPPGLAAKALAVTRAGRSGAGSSQSPGLPLAALRLALRIHDEAAALRIVRLSADQFDSHFLALIAREGTPDLMRAVLRPGRPGLFNAPAGASPQGESLDAALPEQLEKAVATVPEEDLRYLARLAVNAIPPADAGGTSGAATLAPAGERLRNLAAEFPKITFREVALRDQALGLLVEDAESAAGVMSLVKSALEGLPLTTIATLTDRESGVRKRNLFFGALRGDAYAGEFSLLQTTLEDIYKVKAAGGREVDWPELTLYCLRAAGNGLLKNWEASPERLRKGCAFFRSVVERPEFVDNVTSWEGIAAFTGLLHALAGESAALQTWWGQLPEKVRQPLIEGLDGCRLGEMFGSPGQYAAGKYRQMISQLDFPVFPGSGGEAKARKHDVFLRFMALPLSPAYFNSLQDFQSAGWGTIADALRLEAAWCVAAPRGSETAQAFTRYHFDRGDYARSLAAAERGLAAAPPARHKNGLWLMYWKLFSLKGMARAAEGTETFLAAANTELPEEEAEDSSAQHWWQECTTEAITGPARDAGSLEAAIRIAGVLYPEAKDAPLFWKNLATAGVLAGESPAGKGTIDSRAAGTFALKAIAAAKAMSAQGMDDLEARALILAGGAVSGAPLLGKDATWRWLEEGTVADGAWREAAFDDSAWKSGSGPFGFGDDGLKTEFASGNADGSRRISWPFRAEFTVSDPESFRALRLNLRVDDGGIVWLNGKEAGRQNLPEDGEITPDTLAPQGIAQAAEGKFLPMMLDPALVVKGRNIIAIQVHQQHPESSDAAFHAELVPLTGSAGRGAPEGDPLESLRPLCREWPEELRTVFMEK